ncbi:MAG: hypothetical protein R8G34_13755 [Paracoccaceae bacterium]|nr:hypothetical protein [Paracoccaceae bacterium]
MQVDLENRLQEIAIWRALNAVEELLRISALVMGLQRQAQEELAGHRDVPLGDFSVGLVCRIHRDANIAEVNLSGDTKAAIPIKPRENQTRRTSGTIIACRAHQRTITSL